MKIMGLSHSRFIFEEKPHGKKILRFQSFHATLLSVIESRRVNHHCIHLKFNKTTILS